MSQNKLRVIKDYEKLEKAIQNQIKEAFPYGFSEDLISINSKDGSLVRALPFETDDRIYLVKFPSGHTSIVEEEDDDSNDEIIQSNKKPDMGKDFEDDFKEDEQEDDEYGDEPDGDGDMDGEEDDDD